jgi:hypothetical protein
MAWDLNSAFSIEMLYASVTNKVGKALGGHASQRRSDKGKRR